MNHFFACLCSADAALVPACTGQTCYIAYTNAKAAIRNSESCLRHRLCTGQGRNKIWTGLKRWLFRVAQLNQPLTNEAAASWPWKLSTVFLFQSKKQTSHTSPQLPNFPWASQRAQGCFRPTTCSLPILAVEHRQLPQQQGSGLAMELKRWPFQWWGMDLFFLYHMSWWSKTDVQEKYVCACMYSLKRTICLCMHTLLKENYTNVFVWLEKLGP